MKETVNKKATYWMGEGIYKWYIQNIQRTHTTQHQTNETIGKVKRQPSEWEKIIANEATDKEFITKL